MRRVPLKELILYGLIFVNVLIFITGLILFKKMLTDNSELLTPPDVRGKSIEDATNILSKNNFKIVIKGVLMNRNKEPLVVLDQNPVESKLPSGGIVFLWLNMPAKIVKIPDLRYKDVAEARNILENLGLKAEPINGEEGYVLRQMPEPGLYVEKGATIVLYNYIEPSVKEESLGEE